MRLVCQNACRNNTTRGDKAMKKRVIGFLLAVVMLLTIMPQLTPEAKAHKSS
jgi:heme/copper-type cytochrome/quinol oxidase subunit 4